MLGALFTVGGTWFVSIRLDRQKERRELYAAIGIVASELEENRRRVANKDGGNAPLRQRLTLGDWARNKGPFAGLALRNERLWKAVVDAYGVIHEFRSDWRDDHPSADRLNELVRQLHEEQLGLRRELGVFSWLLPRGSNE
jgi:hypothetical protein